MGIKLFTVSKSFLGNDLLKSHIEAIKNVYRVVVLLCRETAGKEIKVLMSILLTVLQRNRV